MNFKELIDSKASYNDPTIRPRSMAQMADKCGLSRQHLYNLFIGRKKASSWTAAKIAKGLGEEIDTVQKALAKSREEYLFPLFKENVK